jgi:hypothetical protein
MTDPVADIITTAQLAALVERLEQDTIDLQLRMSFFNQQIMVIKELIKHPPPHPDPGALRQHVAGRVNDIRETIDKMRALLPPDMRGE